MATDTVLAPKVPSVEEWWLNHDHDMLMAHLELHSTEHGEHRCGLTLLSIEGLVIGHTSNARVRFGSKRRSMEFDGAMTAVMTAVAKHLIVDFLAPGQRFVCEPTMDRPEVVTGVTLQFNLSFVLT